LNAHRLLAFVIAAANLVTVGCGSSVKLSSLTAQELFQLGKQKYEKKKYLSAAETFQQIVFNHPGESVVDSAQYYLALTHYADGEYLVAAVEFNRLATNYPSSAYFEQAIFMKAVCFFEGAPSHYGLDQSDLDQAIRQFEDFLIDFPESEVVPDAQKYLLIARTRLAKKYYHSGVVYTRMGATEAARKYYQKVIDDFTDTEFAPLAAFSCAEMDMKKHKFEEAWERFSSFGTAFPNHDKAQDAGELAVKSAFESAIKAFVENDMSVARERFQRFVNLYPDSRDVNKARAFLAQIEATEPGRSQADNAESP